ncbi:MAG: hypothetical protein U0Q16_38780 [Bryobacteraceae bacterium]
MAAVEERFGFEFPPDLRAVLQFVLPAGTAFPNWSSDSEANLRSRMDSVVDGIWFDVEHCSVWPSDWGARPANAQARFDKVKEIVGAAPRLIPIYGHRFIPAEPNKAGNPVFSVHQTDIICYGNDLADYFHREFDASLPEWAAKEPRNIRFWSDSVRWRD